MEELVHHKHYNNVLQTYSYVHMASVLKRRNWLMAPLCYSLKQWMTELADRVVQMTVLVIGQVLVIENSWMEALQMLSKHH